jgi:hypothetical protein
MTVPERVVAFLAKNRPAAFCDDCIAEQLKLTKRQEVQPVHGEFQIREHLWP